VTGRDEGNGSGYSTAVGFVNKNGQVVIRKTDLDGNDHRAKVYQLGCSICGHVYGANSGDIWLRKCPKHDQGAPGLAYEP
jgi:hypothetical protein